MDEDLAGRPPASFRPERRIHLKFLEIGFSSREANSDFRTFLVGRETFELASSVV
jgi:hypothetical protein